LGIAVNKHDHLLSTRDWVVRDTFCVFGVNFEETMHAYFGESYARLETEARDRFGLTAGLSKPFVARYIADRIDLEDHPEGLGRLKSLAKSIGSLTTREQEECAPTPTPELDDLDIPF
jgi:hypothetical protein